jgi:hypothetical protein
MDAFIQIILTAKIPDIFLREANHPIILSTMPVKDTEITWYNFCYQQINLTIQS